MVENNKNKKHNNLYKKLKKPRFTRNRLISTPIIKVFSQNIILLKQPNQYSKFKVLQLKTI